jgi:hypothetical protein
VLDRDEERKLERLARERGVLGTLPPVRQPFEQGVGVGLQPRELAIGRGAARALVEGVEASVGGDAVEPRPHRRPACIGVAAPPRTQERLLHELLGLLEGAEHPVAVQMQLAPVPLDTLTEPGPVEHPQVIGHGGHGRCDGIVSEKSSPRTPPPRRVGYLPLRSSPELEFRL